MYDYFESKFNKLNAETNKHRTTCVDRFNPSTQSNRRVAASNPSCPIGNTDKSSGYYDGRGVYHPG